MKHYAENLGTNVAAMIKVRQVFYPAICNLWSKSVIWLKKEFNHIILPNSPKVT